MEQDDEQDEPIGGWHWHREANDTFPWVQLGLPEGLIPNGLADDQRFELWVARFKSSSPDCETFVHDPVASMIEGGVIESRDVHVTTHVINHERTLSKFHLFATATKSAGSVGLTLYKVAPPED